MMKSLSLSRQFCGLLLLVTVLRLLWHLVFNPIGITGDEAYNWDWGRHLAWGYYSKPPGSAWLHGLVHQLSGGSLFAIKATATLLAGLSTLFLFLTLRHLFAERFAFWVGLVYLLCPGQLMVSSILTADAQLLVYWNLALWATVQLLFPKEEGKAPWGLFVLLGVALALGHLAKQMMLIQFPLLLLATALIRPALLRHPLLYLAPLLSLVSLLPPLYWNAQNDWITVAHTAHHFEAEDLALGDILERFGVLLALSALLLTPLAVAAIPRALTRWARERSRYEPRAVFLTLYGALPFAVMFLMTLRQDVNPNWPAVYHGATLALAGWFFAFEGENLRKAWRVTLRLTLALTAVVVVFFTFAEFFFEHIGPARAQRRTYWGYPELAEKIARHDPKRTHAIIVRGHRDGASELAFNLPGQPEVHVWNESEEIAHQYDFWPGPEPGTPALLIIERRRESKPGLPSERMRESFAEIEFLGEYEMHSSRDYPRFRVYRTSPLLSWPSPVPTSRR
ncbi:ArnT family glycosyltransferase [Roseibacillus ishigakijimensis]|uniref:Glycosyltransferase family 39 protein n=1 Tax=Roseibacillus ishigakijimensis TaxID=454146 RepID=A0A934RWG9_9BACT|nr:glycosyltransferase family 39 protein [Roseibacillus ishigakijimensis]MBK1835425.1 glycosyltransferase family 39 protein [Roseibacillus ishigakijimensis]